VVFDRLVATAQAAVDLIVLDAGEGDAACGAANEAIAREARALAWGSGGGPRRLVAVWSGRGRREPRPTPPGGFRTLATQAGFEERSVATL
jgi:hypothetical protein